MEILWHKINYKLYTKNKLSKKDIKKIFYDIYKKHLNFWLIYWKNWKIIWKWYYKI